MRKIAAVMVAMAGLCAGCSVMQSPTPRSDVRVVRYAPLTETGADGRTRERMGLADEIGLPESWTTGTVELKVEEDYVLNQDGAEALARRRLHVRRESDAAPAAAVADARADAVGDLGALLGSLLASVATQSFEYATTSRALRSQETLRRIEAEERRAIAEEEAETAPE